MKYQITKSSVFVAWYFKQDKKTRAVIDARLDRIQLDAHFGFTNRFEGLIELKWTSGMRIYTFLDGATLVVVLLGGNKNGQSKDIKEAKKIRDLYLQRTHSIDK